MDKEWDVFLCHNSKDKLEIETIRNRLIERNIKAWIDKYDFEPFQPWFAQLESIISSTKAAALFVGSAGLGPWQTQEIRLFIEQLESRDIRIGIVILPNCPDDFDFRSLDALQIPVMNHWVDFRQNDPDPVEHLIYGITGKRSELLLDATSSDWAATAIPIQKESLSSLEILRENKKTRIELYQNFASKTQKILQGLEREIEEEKSKVKKITIEIEKVESLLILERDTQTREFLVYLADNLDSISRKIVKKVLKDNPELRSRLENNLLENKLFAWTVKKLLEKIRYSLLLKNDFDFYKQLQELHTPQEFIRVYEDCLILFKQEVLRAKKFKYIEELLNQNIDELIECLNLLQD